MIDFCRDPERYLYHFTRPETALMHILPSCLLKLSRYTTTNDPKESKTWQFHVGTTEGKDLDPRIHDSDALSEWLSAELKSRTRVLCFATDRGPFVGNHIDDLYRRGFAKPSMWSHYAENHTGVCLVFNRELLIKRVMEQVGATSLLACGKVNYVDRSVIPDLMADQEYRIDVDMLERIGTDAYPEQHLRRHMDRLFFEKLVDWRNESEWRIVAFAKSHDDLFVSYGNALDGVVFGEAAEESTILEIMELTAAGGTQTMGLKWKNSAIWYDYVGQQRYQQLLVRKKTNGVL